MTEQLALDLTPDTPVPVYADDWVTLYHGNCFEIRVWLDADVLVTDPPYGLKMRSGGMSNAITPFVDEVEGDASTDVRDRVLTLWGTRPALVFGSWRIPRPSGTRNRLIWYKAETLPGMRPHPWYSADEEIYQLGSGFGGPPVQNVHVTHDRRDGAAGEVVKYGHPTPKPVGLMEQLIMKCPPGVIADPCAGVGSTLLAARNAGRRAIGVELEHRHCVTAVRRLTSQPLFQGETPT
jgi:DNA modification methylase